MTKITSILLTGFLGAGKTTLLSHLLNHDIYKGKRLAVLVNDFGTLPVDGALLPQGDHYITEINKGSIFCVCVKTDLLKNLNYIAQEIKPDILFIEATGAAEPTDFTALIQTSQLKESYQRGPTLCVADALNFPKLVTILPALKAQVQISDFIILNKIDLVTNDQLEKAKESIQTLNPAAHITETEYGKVDPQLFLNDFNRTEHEFEGDFQLCSEAPKGTSSFEFRKDGSVDKISFYKIMDNYRNVILRGKGIVDFGSESLYVEVVNGIVSSKPARNIHFEAETKSAMSFVFRNQYTIFTLKKELNEL